MKWLMAASEGILSGAIKAITEIDLENIEKFIQVILEARNKKIFVVSQGRNGCV